MKEKIEALYDALFGKPWKMWQGSIVVAVLTIGLFLIYQPWTTWGFIVLGQHLYHTLGVPLSTSAPDRVDFVRNPFVMLWVMMLWGVVGSSLMAKEFALRVPPKAEMLRGFLGGTLVGIGFILATGCTAGAFFNGLATMSAGALFFGLGLFIGSFLAVRYHVWEITRFPHWSDGKGKTYLRAKKNGSLMPLAGLIVFIAGFLLSLIYNPDDHWENIVKGFVLIGLMIGVALQRSGFCITKAFREPWLTGDAQATVDIIVGIVVALFGFALIKSLDPSREMAFVEATYMVPGLVGGVIFGFGMVIVGGCTVGCLRGAGNGFVKFWFGILGMVLSGPLTAEYVQPAFMNALPPQARQKLFLPQARLLGHPLGYTGSVALILLILFLWYLFVKWNERTNRCSAF